MTDGPGVAPLVVEFQVAAPVGHAFETWTDRAQLWGPRGHTVSGAPDAVVFERRPGGRIYERSGGDEHEWGEILVWEPPTRVRYRWHLFFPPAEATIVDVTFTAVGDDATRVRLEQTGWEALGDRGPARRERTVHGWAVATAAYRGLLERPVTSPDLAPQGDQP